MDFNELYDKFDNLIQRCHDTDDTLTMKVMDFLVILRTLRAVNWVPESLRKLLISEQLRGDEKFVKEQLANDNKAIDAICRAIENLPKLKEYRQAGEELKEQLRKLNNDIRAVGETVSSN